MFEQIRNSINEYINTSNNSIIVDSNVIHDNKKLEYALSANDYMASISILSDLTYDFFVGEFESEKIVLSKTLYFSKIEDLLKQIRIDLDGFSQLNK
jgi:hypothetical protein